MDHARKVEEQAQQKVNEQVFANALLNRDCNRRSNNGKDNEKYFIVHLMGGLGGVKQARCPLG